MSIALQENFFTRRLIVSRLLYQTQNESLLMKSNDVYRLKKKTFKSSHTKIKSKLSGESGRGQGRSFALSRPETPTRVVIPPRVRPDWRNIKLSCESLSSPADKWNSPSWNGPTSLSTAYPSFSRCILDVPVSVRARFQCPARPLLLPFTGIPC